ncbi:hypothetical protein [Zhongshania sp. BJYM1]|uniref:hypothetical protein n=1 Tax=Zhongshania aquatica TaxID=2965069 RepID=UPI0022B56751|nr:hypothetical protein [Marortus sp. BJYM1]
MTKKLGRPLLKSKPLTQAERHQRWKTNQELRKKELIASTKPRKKRLNLALKEVTLDGVDIIAKSLELSTTAAIELLLYRAAKQTADILSAVEDTQGEIPSEPEMLARLRYLIRAGHGIESLREIFEQQDEY